MAARNNLPAPDGFREFALTHKVKETRVRYNIGAETFQRWADQVGLTAQISGRGKNLVAIAPLPNDFATRADIASTLDLAEHYRVSKKTVHRWRRIASIPAPRPSRRIEIPADFTEFAPRHLRGQCALHYGVGEGTVSRWARETRVCFKTWTHPPIRLPTAMEPTRDTSLAGQAQRHLQRLMPVVKASVVRPEADGYLVGGRLMATEQMVAMAQAKGFDPDDWRRI